MSPRNTLTDLTSGRFEEVVSGLSRRELTVVQDAEETRAFFDSLVVERSSVPVTIVTAETGAIHAEMSVGPEGPLSFSFETDASLPGSGTRWTVVLSWLGRTYCFFGEPQRGGDVPALALPSKVYVVHRRFWDRLSTADSPHKVRLLNSDGSIIVEGSVTDVTHRGVGVSCDGRVSESIPVYSGVHLEITLAGAAEPISVHAEVIHSTRRNGRAIVGCRVEESESGRFQAVFSTAVEASGSGVVKVSSEQDRSDMAGIFKRSTLAGARLTREVAVPPSSSGGPDGAYFMLRGGPGIGAAIGVHRVYHSTWLVHTLGLTPEYSTALPKPLFERLGNFVVGEKGGSYVCGFWPAQSRVLDRSYTAFVQNDFHEADHHLEVLHLYQYRSDASIRPARSDDLKVELLKADTRNEAQAILRTSVSCVFWDATNLDDLFSPQRGVAPLPGKRRCCLVARDSERVHAVALVEWADDAALTFGLANHCRLYFAEGADREEIGRELFRSALAIYSKAGIPSCTLCVPENEEELGAWPGVIARLGRVYFWIARSTRVKLFLRHLERLKWELEFLDRHRSEIKPSTLKKLRFRTESFKRRQCIRLDAPEAVANVRASVVLLDGREVPVSLMSLDTFGCGVEIPPAVKPEPGARYRLVLRLAGDTIIETDAEVKYAIDRPTPGWGALTQAVGFSFIGLSHSAAEILREFVFATLNPDLRPYTPDDFISLTGLFEKAGYLDYFPGTDRKRLVEEGSSTYSALDRLHPNLVRVALLKNEDGMIGSHSFYRLTPSTWLLHQLVVDETPALYKARIPTNVLLQGTFQFLGLDPTARHFVTHFHDEAPIARTYFEVPNHHDNPRDYAFVPFRGFLFDDLASTGLSLSGATDVGLATDEEVDAISGYLENLAPRIEYEALGFSDPRLSAFVGDWQRHGFERQRRVFVARSGKGEMLHFAIADLAPRGANMIGILDRFRIFDVPWRGSAPEEACLDLARFVADYYRSQGRTRVYLEVDEVARSRYTALPIRDLGKNWRLVVSRSGYMTILQFFQSRFEKLEHRLLDRNAQGLSGMP